MLLSLGSKFFTVFKNNDDDSYVQNVLFHILCNSQYTSRVSICFITTDLPSITIHISEMEKYRSSWIAMCGWLNFFFGLYSSLTKTHPLWRPTTAIYYTCTTSSCRVSDGDQNRNLSTDFNKNTKYEIARKFFWLESRFSLPREDGQT